MCSGTSWGAINLFVNNIQVWISNSAYFDSANFMVSAGDSVKCVQTGSKYITASYYVPYTNAI